MSTDRFPICVHSVTIPGRIGAASKYGGDFNAHIRPIYDTHKFSGMQIVTQLVHNDPHSIENAVGPSGMQRWRTMLM